MGTTKIYKSKIGLELIIPVALVLGIVLILTVISEPHWVGVAILLPVILFISYMFLTTYYTIENDTLKVKCGFYTISRIDIKNISKITETNNPISSPATSLDRLEIRFNKYDNVLISPKDKLDFIHAIKTINPNVEIKLKIKN